MKRITRRARPQRTSVAAQRVPRVSKTSVAVVRTARPLRIEASVNRPALACAASLPGFSPDPYVDYACTLTPEGGIAIAYKDLDLRLRHTLYRLFLWTVATAGEAWILFRHQPVHPWLAITGMSILAVVNWLIVAKPIEVYRRIEVRPDGLLLESSEIFWLHKMEGGWPAFRPDAEGNLVLCGTYGTRFVEYLMVRRFDERDRMPEVFVFHLQEAMRQLWSQPR